MEKIAVEKLSERELEVLNLLAQFYENIEIAEKLFIKECTVKAHVMSILRKLNVYSRAEAVIVGIKLGLIPLEKVNVRVRKEE